MREITKLITFEEIETTLTMTPTAKASGLTGISYEIIKNLSPIVKQKLTGLLNEVIIRGQMSKDWITSYVTLFSKPKDWEGNLDITRLITLIKTVRKLLTKILTERMTMVIYKTNTLSPFNFADLPGGSTLYLIITLKNIIEDTKEKGNPFLIMFQDIKEPLTLSN